LAVGFGSSYTEAVDIALWVTLALLAGCGYLAAHVADITRWRLVAETAFAGLAGACVVRSTRGCTEPRGGVW
jgi:hypothetical protein